MPPSPQPETNPFLPGAKKLTAPPVPATISWTAESISGSRKPINDDSWLAFSSDIHGARVLESDGSHSLASHDVVFAVSDGMGGGRAGDAASAMLLETLSAMIPRTFKTAASGLRPDYLSHLKQAISAVHLAINAEAAEDPSKKGMAATLALAWFTPDNLYLAHVGDSRIYLHRDHGGGEPPETRQLTEDHTFVWKKMHRGEISEREYRCHPRRSALYEVVGGGHQGVSPDVASVAYQPGDRFLICSDGLIDGLWQKHIHSAFLKNPDSTSSLAQALISRAVSNDGTDDTTLITLDVSQDEK
ncbi:serine/threonine-protein phosphatase [Verrucomicrobiaceae bacterium N1E253]|uniref:Serine/threonine-protein phosphatase n=1 Tax=Oceaniferula marina TaxID=2748318 RepID=A0A851GES8_9BACT|nr:protein phosphatase 2C domain-containing protein [Oceaniferula marina]NWK54231.1 serine/threonine-protein phosphatase [Oceaniferula marina]